MPLIPNSKQNKGNSLESFYEELRNGKYANHLKKVGEMMLAFIQMVNLNFKETNIWGLTSHSRLVLQNGDDWKSNWLVVVECIGSNEYYFSYLMPTEISPWPNATVRGVAQSLEEAKKYLLIAMIESKGWEKSSEVQKLFRESVVQPKL